MYPIDPITISLFFMTFLAIVLYGLKKKNHPNYPPGPPCLPVIGNMHNINYKKPYQTFEELAQQYGSVYSLQIGTQKMVVLCGYETVKDALVNHAEDFAARPYVPIFWDLTNGYGLSLSNGNTWKAMRRFTLSTLKDFGMGRRTLEEKISEESDILSKKFKIFKGKPFDDLKLITASVANIIVSILFGLHFDYEDTQFCRLLELINKLNTFLASPMVNLYNAFPNVVRWLPGKHKSSIAIMEELHSFLKDSFIKQRSQLDINDQRSFTDAFLIKQNKELNPEFSDTNLTYLLTDLFAAGMETTTTTLRWGLLLMIKYPEIQKNVQKEIEKVIGTGVPQYSHRNQLPYTNAVIHEIQRFSNILPTNLPHATTKDVTFKGFFLPKGTQVIPLLYSVLRDKEHFEKPDMFNPEHFLDLEGNFVKNEAFLPFSAGKRSCAGENLAKMELFLFFTKLLQNFTFQAPPGVEVDITPAVAFICFPLQHEICAIPRT